MNNSNTNNQHYNTITIITNTILSIHSLFVLVVRVTFDHIIASHGLVLEDISAVTLKYRVSIWR